MDTLVSDNGNQGWKRMETIRVMIVDDIAETCENIKCLLHFEPRIEVIGVATDGEEAVKKAEKLQPHVILMDINMPIMDGITATEIISCRVPNATIVIMSVQGEQEYLRKAMASGAREYIIKPFTSDELIETIYRVYELEKKRRIQLKSLPHQGEPCEGKVVTVFSTKGGVGKTTLAVNLGVCLAQEYGFSVALLDLDLQFGDTAVMLNLTPRQTISDLASEFNQLDAQLLESCLIRHSSGLRLMAAPTRPEFAELVSAPLVEKVIRLLKERYDYIIIDTPCAFTDPGMVALDYAHKILLVVSTDLPTLKNLKLGLEVLESLHHKDKVRAVLNRAAPDIGIGPKDVEKTLGLPITCQIPSDGRLVVGGINRGKPFIIDNPQSKVAESLRQLACQIVQNEASQNGRGKKKGFLRLFN